MRTVKAIALFLLFSVITMTQFSCTKSIDVIGDNDAPFDPTVSLLLRENFINKAWLTMWGRYPTDAEKQSALVVLDQNNCSLADRTQIFDQLVTAQQYRDFQYSIDFNNLLDYPDQGTFDYVFWYFEQYINDTSNPQLQAEATLELGYMNAMVNSGTAFLNGEISLVEAHKKLVSNQIYYWTTGTKGGWADRAFPYFLYREKTEDEGYRCGDMMSGFDTTLFGVNGDSFDDMVNIFFSSPAYFEGQVRTQFHRLHKREPSFDELADYFKTMIANNDIKEVQKRIVLSQEFLSQ